MKRILAFTDNVTTCDCCGKNNLKGTYAVTDDLGGEFYYGSVCVKRNLGYTKEDVVNDINKTKNIAQNEYSEAKDEIRKKNLHPLLENREFNAIRLEIANKYKIQPMYV